MITFLKIFIVVLLALAFVGWLSDRRAAANRPDVTPGLSFLPGDIKYQSLFPYCDVDRAFGRAHADPSPLWLSAATQSLECEARYAIRVDNARCSGVCRSLSLLRSSYRQPARRIGYTCCVSRRHGRISSGYD
jgi:hypothetical protein